MIRKRWIIAVVLLCVLCGAIGYTYAQSSITPYIMGGPYPGAPDYTVWEESGTFYGKDSRGEIDYSGTNATTVIQNCMDAITSGWIVLKEVKLPLAVTLQDDVFLQEIYKGTLTEYPFPRNMEDFTSFNIFSMDAFQLRGDYLVLHLSIDAWVNPAETNFGVEQWKSAAAEVTAARYYGTYQWSYYHTGNETGEQFAVGLAWEADCTLQGAYFQQNTDGSLITDTAIDGNVEQQAVSDAEWDVNTESTLKIVWNATAVAFYVDDTLINTHTTRVPDEPMQFLMEIVHNAHVGNYVTPDYMYVKDFRSYIDG